jgi:alpha-L-rhamnosidase
LNSARFLLIPLAIACLLTSVSASPVHLRCEYLKNPLGIDSPGPRLSWQSDSSERNWKQTAYEVMVASSSDRLQAGETDIWDSGKTESDESVGLAYKGPALESRKRYYWKVRVWDSSGKVADSTEDAWWEMGLLHPSDWKAKWITWSDPEVQNDRKDIQWVWVKGQDAFSLPPKANAKFRLKVRIKQTPRSAFLMLAVRGSYSAKINGHDIGGKKAWESFDERDITDELKTGDNVIEVKVDAIEIQQWGPNAAAKTTTGAFAALLKITRADGSVQRLPTGKKWQAAAEKSNSWKSANPIADVNDTRLSDPGSLPQPASCFRHTVTLSEPIRSARLYVTALGSYRVFLNGARVGNDVLTPDLTDYRKRVLYQTYDVTALLKNGRNEISALLGDGWYGSPLTWAGAYFFVPPDRFQAQLEVDYSNGSHETVVTDDSWKAASSPVLASQVYGGEIYDARQEKPGWLQADFDDSHWNRAHLGTAPDIAITSQITDPARVTEILAPKKVTPLQNGAYVFDMGQNMVGWVTLKVKGAAGTRVKLRFAEVLNSDGTIYTTNLRNADATDTYILKGGDEEIYSPYFTFHGFRYVEVSGYPSTPSLDAIQGDVVSSVSSDPSARLATSSDLVNHMWQIGLWGQRGNFLSIPTDCPQRDERLGWMGDAEVFWRTGSYNFNIAAFSQKFIQDIVDAQTSQGAFTNVSPNTLPVVGAEGTQWWNETMVGAPGWGDAGVIVPWTTWLQYGDRAVIQKNWDAMQRWMDFIERSNPNFLRRHGVGPSYGDWLAPDPNTNEDLLATAYWELIANMMSEMAHVIGRESDARRYDVLQQNIREAFQKAYIKADGTVGTGTQTSYVAALYTKMAPQAMEPLLVDKLVKDIESRNWHLSTGFLGTPLLLFTLSDHGRSDVAYRLLLNETYPSWGYMLAKGATTWWERWDGDTGDASMNSFNHYAFGSVIAWVYRYAAGIDTTIEAPGFKEIVVHPHLDSRMPSAAAEYDSIYGRIATDWHGSKEGPFSLQLTIPPNTSAKIFLPAIAGARVTEGGRPVPSEREGDSFVVNTGSGSYNFEVR